MYFFWRYSCGYSVRNFFIILSNISELNNDEKSKKFCKIHLPNKKSYPFIDICGTFFDIPFTSLLGCKSFEFNLLLMFFNLSSKYVFVIKSEISILVTNFACFNFPSNNSPENSIVVTYLS